MPERDDALRVDPAGLDSAITTYDQAADRMTLIISDVLQSGRIATPWTGDRVSVAMAEHYNTEAFDGEQSTFQALRRYELELRSAADTLRLMRNSYVAAEAEAASTLHLSVHLTGS